MEPQNKKIIVISSIVIIFICIGVISAGYVGYQYLTNTGGGFFLDSPNQSNPVSSLPTPDLTPATETPFGSEIDLEELFAPMWQSVDILNEYYVSQPIDTQVLADGALEGLVFILEQELVDLSIVSLPGNVVSAETLARDAQTPEEALTDFIPFWETWQKVEFAELSEELTYETLMHYALAGMLASLNDPYTAYMDPGQYAETTMDLSGKYEGIGAWVNITTDYITITSPMKDSPAEKAGLLPGDRIIAIDGEDMTGVDGYVALLKVRGPEGTTVVLTIDRDNVDEPFDVAIVRAQITLPNVDSEILENGILYIILYNFNENSHEKLRETLRDGLAENPSGIIMDLRGNGGGFRQNAVNITSEFIEDGTILLEEYGNGNTDIHKARTFDGLATEIPLVVLVDSTTASSAEIFAGAIQDHERGPLVGTTTFGKGVVWTIFPLSGDQGVMRMTIANWLTPNERTIHGVGLEPDYFVEYTEENALADEDPQLDKAIELLTTP
jgi:carboxyl-terminal processing protease